MPVASGSRTTTGSTWRRRLASMTFLPSSSALIGRSTTRSRTGLKHGARRQSGLRSPSYPGTMQRPVSEHQLGVNRLGGTEGSNLLSSAGESVLEVTSPLGPIDRYGCQTARDRKFKTDEAGVAGKWCRLKSVAGPSAWAIEVREADMTRAELDAALARLGLAVPEGERDQIFAAAHLIEDMVARLRPV